MKTDTWMAVVLSAFVCGFASPLAHAQTTSDTLPPPGERDITSPRATSENTDSTTSGDIASPKDPSSKTSQTSGISSTTTSAPTSSTTPSINPYEESPGPLMLLNCSNQGITVNTYNSNDTVMWVPFQTVNVGVAKLAGLKCATSSCKLKIGGYTTGALSGARVYVGGTVRPTNLPAINMGCDVYK